MMTRTVIALVLAATFARESLAQVPAAPTAGDVERERARIETTRRPMFDPANPAAQPAKGKMPAAADIDREMQRVERERKDMFDPKNPTLANPKNVFPDIPTPAPSGIDIEAIARQYEGRAQARKADELMVFASFTMPPESLRRLVQTAGRVGAAVIFRGFKNNSLKETALALQALQQDNANVLVNPNAFTQYKVAVVPTVVLAKPSAFERLDGDGCSLPATYAAVAGDVTLDYALEEIARRSPKFEPLATRYVRLLKGKL